MIFSNNIFAKNIPLTNILSLLIYNGFSLDLVLVTTTESSTIALSLFQARDDYYDIVIVDIGIRRNGHL